MTIGSLFSGIGGLDLGLEWAGLGPVLWQVEADPYCRQVLARHWPDAQRYDDVRTVDGTALAPVDVLCGGFPCQDISAANPRGRGLDGERSGLWFEYLRLIDEIRPRAVVIENVSRLVRRGLDTVVSGLDGLGYAVEGTRLRAGDVGAPHRRERLFVVAYRAGVGRPVGRDVEGSNSDEGAGQSVVGGPRVAYAHGEGQPQQGRPLALVGGRAGDGGRSGPPQPGVGGDPDGATDRLDCTRWPAGRGPEQYPWEPARTVAPRSVPHRGARVRALGNCVVPQVAYVVGMRVRQLLEEAP